MCSIASESEYTDKIFKDLAVRAGRVSGSAFYDWSFAKCSFRETNFERCRFTKCEFKGCDLSFVRIPGVAFTGAAFIRPNLTGVDWTAASWGFLSSVEFLGCTLSYGVITDLDLPRLKTI